MSLRQDEEFVITSVAASYSVTWRPGENPPDAYLVIGTAEIAVEISTLTQHVTDARGTRSRLTDDLATTKFANALNEELKELIPYGYTIGLVLSSPILKLRKTQIKLAEIIRVHAADLSALRYDHKLEINDNKIIVFLNHHGDPNYKKVSAAFMNRNSNPDILTNVKQILEDRIVTKAKICGPLSKPVWLALFNDYWLTEADTYRYALSQMSLAHPFQKVLLVNGDKSVHVLFEE